MGAGNIEGGGLGGIFIGELGERVSYLPKPCFSLRNTSLETKIDSATQNNENQDNTLPAIINNNTIISNSNIHPSEPFIVGIGSGFFMHQWITNIGWVPAMYETNSAVNKRIEMQKEIYPNSKDYKKYNLGEFAGFYFGSIAELTIIGTATLTFGLSGIGLYVGAKILTNTLGYFYYKDRLPKDEGINSNKEINSKENK